MKKYLVTGGGGFLGKALILKLKSDGYEVESLSRGSYSFLDELGVKSHQLDLTDFDKERGLEIFKDVDGVFHVAAKVGMSGEYQDFYATNVEGTENLLEYCRLAGVKNFVFTSSPSVIASGKDLCGVDESVSYPKKHLEAYPATKAIAERIVLRANRDKFKSVSLRPHLIFGPNDTSLIPTILEKAKSNKLKIIGSGENKADFNYIDDCVDAHILAMKALEENPDKVSGKAYFVSQGEPYKFWDFVNIVLEKNKLPSISKKVPFKIAYAVAFFAELIAKIFKTEPLLNRFLVEELATNHYFDISNAKNDFGYSPKHSMEEALKLTFAR